MFIAKTTELLDKIKERIFKEKIFSIDLETTVLHPYMEKSKIVGVGFKVGPDLYYIPLNHLTRVTVDTKEGSMFFGAPEDKVEGQLSENVVFPFLEEILCSEESKEVTAIVHNAVFEEAWFQAVLSKPTTCNYFDTKIAAWYLNENRNLALKSLARKVLGHEMTEFKEIAPEGEIQYQDILKVSAYCCDDCLQAFNLYLKFIPGILEKFEKPFYNLDMELIRCIASVNEQKILLDGILVDTLKAKAEFNLVKMKENIFTLAEEKFNINSPKQLGEILFEKLGCPVEEKTPTGNPSTGEAVLRILASKGYPIAEHLIKYKELSKLHSAFLKPYAEFHELYRGVYVSLNRTGTVTGRFTCSKPNLQQVPGLYKYDGKYPLRRAFIAHPGKVFVCADYSQIELRIMAHLSKDKTMCDAFKGEGGDIHQATATALGIDRSTGKTVNFALVYGQSAKSLAARLEIPEGEAQVWRQGFFEKYEGLAEYIERVKYQAREKGYVKTLLGRYRRLPAIMVKGADNKGLVAEAERQAVNTMGQGSGADLLCVVMRNIYKELGDKITLKLQVHDELLYEVAEGEAEHYRKEISRLMEGALILDVPVIAEAHIAKNWGEAK